MGKVVTRCVVVLFLSLLATGAGAAERLGVFEFFVRGGGEYCIAAAPSVIALQDAMQGRAVILEYPFDEFRDGRIERFWSAYLGPSPYLPIAMVGSGYLVAQGPLDYASHYRGMLDSELRRPPRVAIEAWSRRSGPTSLEVFATMRNTGSVKLTNYFEKMFWAIVWEEGSIGLTRTFVRATASKPQREDVPPGGLVHLTFTFPSLAPAEWNRVRALVLLDELQGTCGMCGARWDMMEAAVAQPAAIAATPAAVTLGSGDSATVTLSGPNVLAFEATSDVPWLTVTPASGSLPATLTIAAVGAPAGNASAKVHVTASGAGMSFATDVAVTVSTPATARRPFPQRVHYASGTIRPDRRTQAEQDDDVRAYYDSWKSRYLVAAGTADDGGALYRVSVGSSDPARTLSEGQGYGMMIAAWMAGHDPGAQAIFDGLWRFSRLYPSANDGRLMNREVPVVSADSSSVFGADSDIAYALLLADAQWGSAGAVDYRAEAKRVIEGIAASTIGPQSRLPMIGDWVAYGGQTHNQYTPRSSDLMPDHFRAFAAATQDPSWSRVAKTSQDVITAMQANHSAATGLLPEFIVGADTAPAPAPAGFLEGANDGLCGRSAARVPWRIGFDALVSGSAVSMAQARKISRWAAAAAGGSPAALRSGYALDGTPVDGAPFSVVFVAPFGVAAMTDPAARGWLNDVYDAVRTRHESCHEDSIALLSLVAMSGNAWTPDIRAVRERPVRR